MEYSIQSLLLLEGRFVPIQEVNTPPYDENYIEGAIVWRIGSAYLLTERDHDLVDQLWAYIVDGLESLIRRGQFETYFPDQPLCLACQLISRTKVEVRVGSTRTVVETTLLYRSLLEGAEQFFVTMQQLLPKHNSTWQRYLNIVTELRTDVFRGGEKGSGFID